MVELKVEPKYLRYYANGKYAGEIRKRIQDDWGFQYLSASYGYWNDTRQNQISIVARKGHSEPDIIRKELETMMPFVKPCSKTHLDTPNIRRINIIEHTACEEANYNVGYDSDKDQWSILKHRYGSCTIEEMSLDSVIKRIMKVHYWIDPDDEE